MKPTTHLRFVSRQVYNPLSENVSEVRTVNLLQQWWSYDPECYEDWILKANGAWRDIPLETEK